MKPHEARSVADLMNALGEGHEAKYLCFWGHTPKDENVVDKSCLSNWFPAAFEIDGIHYPTTEHYMMGGKARLFEDDEILAEILAADSPHAAKKLGRAVRNFDGTRWNEHRLEIVVEGNVAKFSQNEDLKEFLLGTGEQVLVEASPRDRIWGIGMGASNPNAEDPAHWRGGNLLGFALMEARARILVDS